MNVLWRDSGGGNDRRGGNGSRGGGPNRRVPGLVLFGRPFRTLAFWVLVVMLVLVTVRMYQGSFMAPQR